MTNWTQFIEESTNAAGAEALEWELQFDGSVAALALEAAVNYLFRNTAHQITPAHLGKAYLDASTDFPDKTPRELGKVIYQYAAKSVYGPSD